MPNRASPPSPWTIEQVHALGLHTDVATAADILGIGRTTAYELIRRDEFPVRVLRVGSRIRVPVHPLLTLLHDTHNQKDNP